MLRPAPEIVRVNIYPTFKDDDFVCANEPEIPADLKQDVDVPYQALLDARNDCADKLDKIRDIVSKWPKNS